MKLFTVKGQSINEIQTETFCLEKDIQQIVEKNFPRIYITFFSLIAVV
jgi:hypothetical protein